MSLPIVGGNKAPSRAPTHSELDMERLMRLANELEDALAELGDEGLTPELIEEIADDLGVRPSHLYVAAAMLSELPCASATEVRIELCVGHCQKWGAVALLDRMLDVHAQRRSKGMPIFDVVARSCLDRCAEAPVVLIHTSGGTAGLSETTRESLDDALAQLVET